MRESILLPQETQALERLLAIAGNDTGQSRRVANFLLAWWNAESCGGFDPTDFWALDDAIVADMLRVLSVVSRVRHYPDSLGFRSEFEALIAAWRPDLAQVPSSAPRSSEQDDATLADWLHAKGDQQRMKQELGSAFYVLHGVLQQNREYLDPGDAGETLLRVVAYLRDSDARTVTERLLAKSGQ